MASQGKNKRKTKGVKVNLQTFLSDETKAPQGFAVVQPINWADYPDDEEEDKYYESKQATSKVILPTVPKSIRTPDFDVSKIPERPPYKAYLGNLPYEATEDEIIRFFKKLKINSVTLIRDGERGRIKGMGFAEFEDRESLIEALQQNGETLKSRTIRISLSEGTDYDRSSRGGLGSNRDDREDRTAGDWRSGTRERDPPRNGSDYQTPFESQPYRGRFSYDKSDRREGGFERGSYQKSDRDTRDRDFGSNRGGGFRDKDYGFRDDRSSSGGYGYSNRNRDGYRDNRYPERSDYRDRGERSDRGGDRVDRGDRDGDRPSSRRYDSSFEPRSSQRYSPSALSTDSKSNDDAPKERPKLKLQPRTKPIENATQEVSNSAIFGGAKPVDTASREREIEEKLKKEKEALMSDTASSKGSTSGRRPLRLSTDSRDDSSRQSLDRGSDTPRSGGQSQGDGSIDGDSRSEDRSDASPKESDSKKSE